MKILHLTHTDIPSDNRILKEISALCEVPDTQLYGIGICRQQGGKPTCQGVPAVIESVELRARRLVMLPTALRHLLVASELFFRFLYRGFKLRPAVVHCHDTPVLLVGMLLKRLIGARLVYDAHELESNKNGQSPSISRMTFWVERLAWSSIDLLVSVSPSIVAWYQERLGEKPSTIVLNSPMLDVSRAGDSRHGEPRPRYFHTKYGIDEGVRVFLYLGLLVPGRGIELVLKAFSSPDVKAHVVFVGYGPLSAEIEQAGGRNGRIHLHPAVPHEEVVPLSRSADVGLCIIEDVSLSDYYCLPNKLFEYAFASIPVLASDFPDIASVVEEYGLGECCSVEESAIVDAIKRLEKHCVSTSIQDLSPLGWEAQAARLRSAYSALAR